MENKKSFGTFICQRRKELGMTQKEFAQRLFVTDSAVSKWERGLAYPDITLLQSICQVLQCSEKELLSSSEDTEGRRAEQLAKKYLQLTRNYRLGQYILYGLITLGCLLGNLLSQHALTWFWIVLASELMVASLTLLPTFVPEGRRGLLASLGGFTGCLLLLLLVCCLYTGGDWFLIAGVSVLFGMGLVFLPLRPARPAPAGGLAPPEGLPLRGHRASAASRPVRGGLSVHRGHVVPQRRALDGVWTGHCPAPPPAPAAPPALELVPAQGGGLSVL